MYHRSDVRPYRLFWLVAFGAIVLGGAIYLIYRPAEPVFFRWMQNAGADFLLVRLRSVDPPAIGVLSDWAVFSLPNALWAFAYTLIMVRIWVFRQHPVKFIWLATIPVLIFGTEILQYYAILPGTFDISDLLAGMAGIAAGIIAGISSFKKATYEKNNYS